MSAGERSPEWSAIAALLALVRQRFGPGYALLEANLKVRGPDGVAVTWGMEATPVLLEQAARAASESAAPDKGSAVDRRILEALTAAEKPLKGRALATRANVKFNAYFWARISHLSEHRKIRKLPGGYWLFERRDPG